MTQGTVCPVQNKTSRWVIVVSGSTMQLYIDKSRLMDEFENLRDLVDAGDIIGVTGTMKRTDKV